MVWVVEELEFELELSAVFVDVGVSLGNGKRMSSGWNMVAVVQCGEETCLYWISVCFVVVGIRYVTFFFNLRGRVSGVYGATLEEREGTFEPWFSRRVCRPRQHHTK